MGYGNWTRADFERYSAGLGRTVTASGSLDSRYTDQQLFVQRGLHPRLDPRGVMRECRDSADHPQSVPVILALDVTGSMGAAAAQVARKLNEVMTRLYDEVRDVEFLVMGIGDLAYDRAPVQMSQFESDIRIAEQLDLVYLEHGGGGNGYESYTAAWYMGLHHTVLDCWKRGRKGLIITMGDEPLDPALPAAPLAKVTGDAVGADVETKELYRAVTEKYDLWHIHVDHRANDPYWPRAEASFGAQLGREHLLRVPVGDIPDAIVRIVTEHAGASAAAGSPADGETVISWDVAPAKEPEPAKKHKFGLFTW